MILKSAEFSAKRLCPVKTSVLGKYPLGGCVTTALQQRHTGQTEKAHAGGLWNSGSTDNDIVIAPVARAVVQCSAADIYIVSPCRGVNDLDGEVRIPGGERVGNARGDEKIPRMILGTGIDIIEVARIAASYEKFLDSQICL